jgi:hypothetical protein
MKLTLDGNVLLEPDEVYLAGDGDLAVSFDMSRGNTICCRYVGVPELRGKPYDSVIYWQIPKLQYRTHFKYKK